MSFSSKEEKIYTDFLTNLAVAWAAGGIITPLFTKSTATAESLGISLIGFLGAAGSLKIATHIARRKNVHF